MLVHADGKLVRAWRFGRFAPDYNYGALRWQVEAVLAAARRNHRLTGKLGQFRQLDDTLWPMASSGAPLSRWAGTIIWRGGCPF
jgi:hypothetical protein